jgi:hypothetical protein
MIPKRRIQWLVGLIFLLLISYASSCTSTTGTKIVHTRDALSRIDNLGIVVKSEEEFSVRLSRDKMTNTGMAFFGLLGYAVEAGARTGSDRGLETELIPKIGHFNLEKQMGYALLRDLESAKLFKTIELVQTEDTTELNRKGIDSLLVVTVNDWGFRQCMDSERTEQIQVGIEAHAVLKQKSTTIWERNDFYLDGKCYCLEELKAQEGILEQILTRAVDNLSANIVNEICFP